MRGHDTTAFLWAFATTTASFSQPVLAAVRWEILNRGIQPSTSPKDTPPAEDTFSSLSALPVNSTRSYESQSILDPQLSHDGASTKSSPNLEVLPISSSLTSLRSNNTVVIGVTPAAPTPSLPSLPTATPSFSPHNTPYPTSKTLNSTYIHHNGSIAASNSTCYKYLNGTLCVGSAKTPLSPTPVSTFTDDLDPTTTDACVLYGFDDIPTVISIVYTTTTTLEGTPEDHAAYTPPYDTIDIPPYCTEDYRFGPGFAPWDPLPTESKHLPLPNDLLSGDVEDSDGDDDDDSDDDDDDNHDSDPRFRKRPNLLFMPTVTFITTAKNPAVAYSTERVPRYSLADDSARISAERQTVANQNMDMSQVTVGPSRPGIPITAGPGKVIIADKTFSNLKATETREAVVNGEKFTIYPTKIVGGGVTVQKSAPSPEPTKFIPSPVNTVVGGMGVSASESIIVIGGTTLNIPPKGLTTSINGEHVSLGPGSAEIGGQTLSWPIPTAQKTNIIIRDGGMLTAIGQNVVVVHSTTITYGPGIASTSLIVDDDTISIGPSGVTIDDITLGGPTAAVTDTRYELVGGLSLTEIGSTLVVVDGVTYTVGDGAKMTTTVVEGETIIAGPNGLVINSMTFGNQESMIVTTIEPSGTWRDNLPKETQAVTGEDDTEDAASALMPSTFVVICIAFGVFLI